MKIFLGMLTHTNSNYIVNANHKQFEVLVKNCSKKLKTSKLLIKSDVNFSEFSFLDQIGNVIFFVWMSLKFLRNIFSLGGYKKPIIFFIVFFQYLYSYFNLIYKIIKSILHRPSYKKFLNYLSRQYNISEAHYQLIYEASVSNCNIAIILEDDAIENSTFTLIQFLDILPQIFLDNDIHLISISESFSHKELGISNLIAKSHLLYPDIFFLDKLKFPVTNTLCAMVYDDTVMKIILEGLNTLRKYALIPVDHKLNFILTNAIISGLLSKQCLAYVRPGIFVQGSIHESI